MLIVWAFSKTSTTFWSTFGGNWATFQSNIWPHCWQCTLGNVFRVQSIQSERRTMWPRHWQWGEILNAPYWRLGSDAASQPRSSSGSHSTAFCTSQFRKPCFALIAYSWAVGLNWSLPKVCLKGDFVPACLPTLVRSPLKVNWVVC